MKTPIRILHVLFGMDLAGTETLLMTLYRNINREKVQFDFAVCANKKCAYDDEIKSLGGNIITYPRYKGKNHISYVKWWNEFFLSHPEYRIIHGHIGSTAAIYLSIAKKYGRYTIAHSHSIHSGRISVYDILYYIYMYPTRKIADYFLGCSKQALIDRYGKKIATNDEKAMVLNNVIDAEKFIYNEKTRSEVRKEYDINNETLLVGTVGRLSLAKNPYETIRIVETLSKKKLDFRFLWVGTGELKNDIEAEIKRKKLERYFIFAGTRYDVYKVLQAMDVFIFPSLWEGLGISCVEAQAAGLPTLCSNTIPIEAKVTKNCKFLPLDDSELWANEIYNLQGYLRKNCYHEIVDAKYDIKGTIKWLEAFYMNHWTNEVSHKE